MAQILDLYEANVLRVSHAPPIVECRLHEKHVINVPCIHIGFWLTFFIQAFNVLSSLLLDHPKSFKIEPLTAVAGDNITLTCRGTRFLYDNLSWYDPLGHRVPNSETILRIEPYSVSLSVKLPNVSRDHALGYECQAFNINSNKVVNTTSVLTINGEFHEPRDLVVIYCTPQHTWLTMWDPYVTVFISIKQMLLVWVWKKL